jgi:branched-chain amino acid transport system permease protein
VTLRQRTVEGLVLFASLSILITITTVLAAAGPTSLRLTGMTMLVNLIIVIGLYVFIGNSGVFSFGSLFFVQIGAYVGALLIIPTAVKDAAYPELYDSLRELHANTVVATIVAALAAMIAALIIGAPLMRLSGITAALGTFVILVIGNVVFTNWEKGTGGAPGLSGIPQTGIWTILVLALICVAIACVFQQTTWCRRLRATREDEIASQAIGVRVGRERLIAFMISAFIVAIAGVAFGQAQQGIFPNAFYLEATFVTLAMLVVGGMRSLTGAVVGAIALSVLAEGLSRLQNGVTVAGVRVDIPDGSQQVGFALSMLVVLLLRPDGLTGGRELTLRLGRARAVD